MTTSSLLSIIIEPRIKLLEKFCSMKQIDKCEFYYRLEEKIMRTHPKQMLILWFTAFTFLGASCEQEPIIGPDPGKEPISVSFTITGQAATSTMLSVQGKVKNTGSNTITAYWYVEGQFYGDNTFTLLLGGDVTTMNIPLNPGVETLWTLEFSDPNIAEGDYPNFAVKDLVAYYNK
jgi:hypothetical protein